MDYRKTATDILKYVGGENNITHLEHCSTRLRFTLVDESKINMEELKKVHGVLGVVMTAQCQVIVGNNVIEVYDELLKLGKFGNQNSNATSTNKKKIGALVLDFIVSVFQPLIPAIAGAGILKSILLLLLMFKVIDKAGHTYLILSYIGDAVFYFLPIMVAITTATKLNVNKVVAVAAMSTLLFPNMTALLGKGANFFYIPITNISYASQVFPAILGVIFYAYMERLFTKISPKPIRIFFVPMMALSLTVPMTLLLLGPIGFYFGTALTAVILFIFNKFGWIAVGLVASRFPMILGVILGNLYKGVQEYFKAGSYILIPLVAISLGASLDVKQLFNAGFSGVMLGIFVIIVNGVVLVTADKFILKRPGYSGAALVTVAGNAIGTPIIVAEVVPSFQNIATTASIQVASAVIITAVFCPILTSAIVKRSIESKSYKETL